MASPTSPGAYVEEIPPQRSIEPAPTSLTAFVGRTRWGPVGQPVVVTSPAQFDGDLGGRWADSELPLHVADFFANGGNAAVVLRLFAGDPQTSRAVVQWQGLRLVAADPGSWGDALRVRVTHDARPPQPALGEGPDDLFTLRVCDGTREELHADVTLARTDHPRHLGTVLAGGSRLVRLDPTVPPTTRPAAHDEPPAGGSPWLGDTTSTGVGAAGGHAGSDGDSLTAPDFLGVAPHDRAPALEALDGAGAVPLVVIPGHLPGGGVDPAVTSALHAYCAQHRAVLLLDSPPAWRSAGEVTPARIADDVGSVGANAALYFPRAVVVGPDGLTEQRPTAGAVAGILARCDAERGVWAAPAGRGARLVGVAGAAVDLTADDVGRLASLGVNGLRALPGSGVVVWGARTCAAGEPGVPPEERYLPVRRLVLHIERSLLQGLAWVTFEPNGEALWAAVRERVEGFLGDLYRAGGLLGRSPREAYFVRCGRDTTTQADLDRGVLNLELGIAPIRPAEFVVLRVSLAAAG